MKIGIQIYLGGAGAEPEFQARAAAAAEARGFHSLWVPEHVVLFPSFASKYPYTVDGAFPFDTRELPMEPFTALAFLAAHTKTIRLGTGISILPQRNPVYTAKQAADVDVLSRGRLDFGIGVGWLEEEFRAVDVPWQHRGSRANDYIGVMKALWTQEVPSFKGRFYDLPLCYQSPKPVQKPHPPLYIGGESEQALKRVAKHAQGWFGVGMTAAQFAARRKELDRHLAAVGRKASEIDVVIGPPSGKATLDEVKAFRDGGCSQIILGLTGRTLDRFLSRLDLMAEQIVLPAARL
ncbi:MAG: LLM class F420-dependent oxidoreductase [Alphaproteobacteria bacterium]|nr:LLM class F420-dependent oxidoreductase [Alphaproteobacteria bacterium]